MRLVQDAIGTVSQRTERLVLQYLSGTERLSDAVQFHSRIGSPYREAALAHDFAHNSDVAWLHGRRKMGARATGGKV